MEAIKVTVTGILVLFLCITIPPLVKWFNTLYTSRHGQILRLAPALMLFVLSLELVFLGMLSGVANYFRWPPFDSSQWTSIGLWLSVIGAFSTIASVIFIRSVLIPDGHVVE